ncbi:nucleolar protein [Pelomyxa schiedti]|nr:nucleolar protein [Pelomyxa schiedti]KAH3767898.1 nucleolar protein [Pelomyxa schiedti]
MGRHKKYVARHQIVKKVLSPSDTRLFKPKPMPGMQALIDKKKEAQLAMKKLDKSDELQGVKSQQLNGIHYIPSPKSSLFFQYNTQLGPPYYILVDTNFINYSIQNKIEIMQGLMDCLYAKCIPLITDCVMAELEKLGKIFRIALRIVRDPRFERLPCTHKGTYADDCIVQRVTMHRCYLVATCDGDLRRRLRKIPGVPIIYITKHRYTVERMPDAVGSMPKE